MLNKDFQRFSGDSIPDRSHSETVLRDRVDPTPPLAARTASFLYREAVCEPPQPAVG